MQYGSHSYNKFVSFFQTTTTTTTTTKLCPEAVDAKFKQLDESWRTYKTMTYDCLEQEIGGPQAAEPSYSTYGGRMDQRIGSGTGFFAVHKDSDGRWTFIDPDGYKFLSKGFNSVGHFSGKEEVYEQGFNDQFNGSEEEMATKVKELFQDIGVNTLGSWSEDSMFKGDNRIPYTPRWNFLPNYRNERPGGWIDYYNDRPVPVFEPEFETFAMKHAEGAEAYKDDPYVLGHFSDNEMPFHADDLINRFLALNETDAGHQAAQKWLVDNGKTVDDITDDDHNAFCVVMVERYYRIINNALKTFDPNHLFLGSRVHGSVAQQDCTFQAAQDHVDVMSINYYRRWGPEEFRIDNWSQQTGGLPLLITEWYAKGNDAIDTSADEIVPIDNVAGAGFTVPTQADRGDFFEHMTLNLLRKKEVVGWHWHRYADYSANLGLVHHDFIPYQVFAESVKKINRNVYSLSDYLWDNTAETHIFMDRPQAY